jgi:hypothetical protein
LMKQCNVWKIWKQNCLHRFFVATDVKSSGQNLKIKVTPFAWNNVLFHLCLFGIFYYNNNYIASWTIPKSLYIFIIFLRSNYLFQLNFHNNSFAKIITNSLKLCYIFFISKLKFHEHLESYTSELLYWKRRQSLELCISKFYCTQISIQTLVLN